MTDLIMLVMPGRGADKLLSSKFTNVGACADNKSKRPARNVL
jgi:hypothetical protein